MRVIIGVAIRQGDLKFFKVLSELKPYQVDLLEGWIEQQIVQSVQDSAYDYLANMTPELLQTIITLS